jgi:antitoxin ParD1/3/4
MNINLTAELQQLVTDKVSSGKYNSATQVIGEALRLLEERDQIQEKRLAELKAKIQEGIEQLDRGEGINAEDVFSELEEDIRLVETQM